MTEGNGHVIDPGGAARRALQAAVAEHGPQALSDADIMDRLGRDQLAGQSEEASLISRAARADVAGQLREQIPQLGNYGAIQSVASTLADTESLGTAACLWVVREFARALGLIASGGTQTAPGTGADAGAGAGDAPPAGPAVSSEPATALGPVASPEAAAAPGPVASPEPAAVPGPAAPREPTGPIAPSGPPAPAGPVVPVGPPVTSGTADGGSPGWPAGSGYPPGPPDEPAPMPAPPGPPGRPASGSRMPSRNVLGIVAAIALVAIYLGVAAAAHLAPFPAKTVAASASSSGGQGSSAAATPAGTPDASADPTPDASPASAYDTLLSMIPASVAGQDNCTNAGTDVGATAVAQCSKLQGGAAVNIIYYSFSSQSALSSGFNAFLVKEHFKKGQTSCTTGANVFTNFVIQCEDGFTSTSPEMTGTIAEYANSDNAPIIVSSDNQQLVMAVMIGTNDGDLLAYWKKLQWISQ